MRRWGPAEYGPLIEPTRPSVSYDLVTAQGVEAT